MIKPKVIIFYATDGERNNIINPTLSHQKFVGRKDIWFSRLGVGKVEATLAATNLLLMLLANGADPKKIECINVGVVGGNKQAFKKTPVGLVGRVYNNDFDTSAVSGLPFIKPFIDLSKEVGTVTCFTQDHFVTKVSDVQSSVGTKFTGKFFVDMELYALARVCEKLGFNLTSIKAVSDIVGGGSQKDQYNGLGEVDFIGNAFKLASKKLCSVLFNMLGGGC